MPTGKIIRWVADKGYGFIARDDGAGDLFCHINNVDGTAESLPIGQKVEFNEAVNPRNGKPEAKSVELLAPIISPRSEVLEDAEREFRSARFVRSGT